MFRIWLKNIEFYEILIWVDRTVDRGCVSNDRCHTNKFFNIGFQLINGCATDRFKTRTSQMWSRGSIWSPFGVLGDPRKVQKKIYRALFYLWSNSIIYENPKCELSKLIAPKKLEKDQLFNESSCALSFEEIHSAF